VIDSASWHWKGHPATEKLCAFCLLVQGRNHFSWKMALCPCVCYLLYDILYVYIADKLDEDYLYSWYRTLYRLFSKAGFHLFHTSSHDTLCLQVTLMQSCVYFLTYVRDPGARVYTMQPPADYGR